MGRENSAPLMSLRGKVKKVSRGDRDSSALRWAVIRRNGMQLLFWLLDGLAAGWLTGKFLSSDGRDQVMDIVMGVAGGVGGGSLFSAAHLVQGKMIYTNVAAVLGAAMMVALSRIQGRRREYGSTN